MPRRFEAEPRYIYSQIFLRRLIFKDESELKPYIPMGRTHPPLHTAQRCYVVDKPLTIGQSKRGNLTGQNISVLSCLRFSLI